MVIVKHMRKMQDEEDTNYKRFINKFMNKHKHLNIFKRVCFVPCALMMEYFSFSI